MAIVAVVTSDILLSRAAKWPDRRSLKGATWLSDMASVHRCARRPAGSRGHRIARFVPGIRTLVFVSVGAGGLSRRRFLLVDACAAAAWVPLVMTCGAAIISLVFGEDSLSLGAWI